MRIAAFADKDMVERICNDPMIRAWTSFEGAPLCDATRYLTPPNLVILFEGGCFLLDCIEPTRYVVHTNILPGCRGIEGLRAARYALALAFLKTDMLELLSMVPVSNPQADWFARANGLALRFTRKALWPNGRQDIRFYGLTIDDWIASGICSEYGKQFHRRLHDQADAEPHPDDPIHDAYVGAVVELIREGSVSKAVSVYNRWARFALYEPISVISEEPLRIDIKQCVIRVEGDSFTVEASHA